MSSKHRILFFVDIHIDFSLEMWNKSDVCCRSMIERSVCDQWKYCENCNRLHSKCISTRIMWYPRYGCVWLIVFCKNVVRDACTITISTTTKCNASFIRKLCIHSEFRKKNVTKKRKTKHKQTDKNGKTIPINAALFWFWHSIERNCFCIFHKTKTPLC